MHNYTLKYEMSKDNNTSTKIQNVHDMSLIIQLNKFSCLTPESSDNIKMLLNVKVYTLYYNIFCTPMIIAHSLLLKGLLNCGL